MKPFKATKRALSMNKRSPIPLSLKFAKSISITKTVPIKINRVRPQSVLVKRCLKIKIEMILVNKTSDFNNIAAFEAVESCKPKNAVISKEKPKIPIKRSFGNTAFIAKRFF